MISSGVRAPASSSSINSSGRSAQSRSQATTGIVSSEWCSDIAWSPFRAGPPLPALQAGSGGTRSTQTTPTQRIGQTRIGWEFVHVAVDDATRLAYVEILDDEKAPTAVGFLRRAVAWFASRGVTVTAVMTDNGTCYRSIVHRDACRRLELRHLRTQPYRPRTNGKAERFIQTMLRGWAYGATYQHSLQRRQALLPWLNDYNNTRPHASLGKRPPAARLRELLAEQRPYE
ncbi:MAG TPA: integrase core domain-containing protein [Vitreimonas sp.]|nr:integrase core domain-containing protein [Vitreimonas sp.]